MAEKSRRACGGCDNYKPGRPYDGSQCRLCWLYHNDERYYQLWSEGEPSAIRKVFNFASALVKHVGGGMKVVPEEVRLSRLLVCMGDEGKGVERCVEYKDGRCRKCGCPLERKARWASERCPLGKWPSSEG